MKRMLQAFVICGALAASLTAQTLPEFDIIPLGGTYNQSAFTWGFSALKIDRVKNKVFICGAALSLKGSEQILTDGGCREWKYSSADAASSAFAAHPQYNGLNNVPPISFWSIDETKGNVSFCMLNVVPGRRCTPVNDTGTDF